MLLRETMCSWPWLVIGLIYWCINSNKRFWYKEPLTVHELLHIRNHWSQIRQISPNLVLEGRCPAEFSFNLPQHTHTETVTDLPKNPQWNVSNKQIMLYWDIHIVENKYALS